MKCPKCGSENVTERATGAALISEFSWVCACNSCHARWTDWQQADNDRLREGLTDLQTFVKSTAANLKIEAEETPEESDLRYQVLYIQLEDRLAALIGKE